MQCVYEAKWGGMLQSIDCNVTVLDEIPGNDPVIDPVSRGCVLVYCHPLYRVTR